VLCFKGLRLYEGSIQALSRLYQASIKALLRLFKKKNALAFDIDLEELHSFNVLLSHHLCFHFL